MFVYAEQSLSKEIRIYRSSVIGILATATLKPVKVKVVEREIMVKRRRGNALSNQANLQALLAGGRGFKHRPDQHSESLNN